MFNWEIRRSVLEAQCFSFKNHYSWKDFGKTHKAVLRIKRDGIGDWVSLTIELSVLYGGTEGEVERSLRIAQSSPLSFNIQGQPHPETKSNPHHAILYAHFISLVPGCVTMMCIGQVWTLGRGSLDLRKCWGSLNWCHVFNSIPNILHRVKCSHRCLGKIVSVCLPSALLCIGLWFPYLVRVRTVGVESQVKDHVILKCLRGKQLIYHHS